RARTRSAPRAEHRRAAVFFIQLDAWVRGEFAGKNGDSGRRSSVVGELLRASVGKAESLVMESRVGTWVYSVKRFRATTVGGSSLGAACKTGARDSKWKGSML